MLTSDWMLSWTHFCQVKFLQRGIFHIRLLFPLQVTQRCQFWNVAQFCTAAYPHRDWLGILKIVQIQIQNCLNTNFSRCIFIIYVLNFAQLCIPRGNGWAPARRNTQSDRNNGELSKRSCNIPFLTDTMIKKRLKSIILFPTESDQNQERGRPLKFFFWHEMKRPNQRK